jgi:predicted DNA-binding transcriptional regulator AlpA
MSQREISGSKIYTLAELRQAEILERPSMAEGLLSAGEAVLLAGKPKTGKSRLLQQQELLTEKSVARLLSVSLAALRRWRLEGRGPRFLKLGAAVRYDPNDVAAWLASRPSGGGK